MRIRDKDRRVHRSAVHLSGALERAHAPGEGVGEERGRTTASRGMELGRCGVDDITRRPHRSGGLADKLDELTVSPATRRSLCQVAPCWGRFRSPPSTDLISRGRSRSHTALGRAGCTVCKFYYAGWLIYEVAVRSGRGWMSLSGVRSSSLLEPASTSPRTPELGNTCHRIVNPRTHRWRTGRREICATHIARLVSRQYASPPRTTPTNAKHERRKNRPNHTVRRTSSARFGGECVWREDARVAETAVLDSIMTTQHSFCLLRVDEQGG